MALCPSNVTLDNFLKSLFTCNEKIVLDPLSSSLFLKIEWATCKGIHIPLSGKQGTGPHQRAPQGFFVIQGDDRA